METKPLVSIIIPVYNGANYMREAIDSALSQTYPNIEILVVNDGSKDSGETEKIAFSYGEKIRYIAKENGGSSSALNVGIRNMQGDFFCWLSHDDVYLPDRVTRLMQIMEEKDKEKTVVICGYSLINEKSEKIFYPKKMMCGNFRAEEMLKKMARGQNICGCSVLLSKFLLEKTGFFDETLRYVNDYDYWYRLINLGTTFVCIEEALVKMRVHGKQVSVTSRDLYHVENRKLLLRCAMDTLENGNYALAKIYAKQNAYFGYRENVKAIEKYIKDVPSISAIRWKGSFLTERLRSFFVQSAKRMYKLLVWKR